MNSEINFQSSFSSRFYFWLLFLAAVFVLSLVNVIRGTLDLTSFFVINGITFLAGHFNFLKYNCQITVTDQVLRVKYIMAFKKTIVITIADIVEIDKHEDNLQRIQKKIFIKTVKDSYIIDYCIADSSDEEFQQSLSKAIINASKKNRVYGSQ